MRPLTVMKLSLVVLVAVSVAAASAQAQPTTTGSYWSCSKPKQHKHAHLTRPSEKHMRSHGCRGRAPVSVKETERVTSVGDPRVSELLDQRWAFVEVLAGIAGTRVESGESVSEALVGVVNRAYAAVAPEHAAPPPFSILPDVHPLSDRGCVFEPGGCAMLASDLAAWRTEALASRQWGDHLERTAREYIALGTPATLDALNAALDGWRAHRDG